MFEEKTWTEFRNSGLLWFINQTLHLFGWAIAMDVTEEGHVKRVYPARVKFRGFSQERNTMGYAQVSNYLRDNVEQLAKEAEEE